MHFVPCPVLNELLYGLVILGMNVGG